MLAPLPVSHRPVWARPAESDSRRLRLGSIVAALAVGIALVGCGARPPILRSPDPRLRGTSTTTAALDSSFRLGTTAPVTVAATPIEPFVAGPETMYGLIATPIGSPEVHKNPAAASAKVAIERKSALGVRTVFAVVGDNSTPWIEVLLPTRPNGAIGWVRRSQVQITATEVAVFVDLQKRSLTVKRNGRSLLRVPVAIGTIANPTPTGSTYITELLDTRASNGAYGPYAFGLGLHSDTLSEFGGGNGQVGIHGTNAPKLIGHRVSHGCVRLSNDDIVRLVQLKLPLGTPVFIT